jgi:hypothetical protein
MDESAQLPGSTPSPGAPPGARIARGCLSLFMLPFFAGGAMAIVAGVREVQRNGWTHGSFVTLAVGVLFCGVAASLVFAAFWGIKSWTGAIAKRVSDPDRPWMWHPDWAEGVVRENRDTPLMLLWPFTIFWNLISLPAWFVVAREFPNGNQLIVLVLLFPIIGLGLLAISLYVTARRAKFGVSTLTLDRIPLQPGTTFHGELQMRGERRPDEGFLFSLSSVRIVTTGSGKSRSVHEYPIWQESRVISASTAALTPNGMRIPFSFDLPPDAEPTDERQMDDRVVWRLSVTAELFGVDYKAQFELPVFHTGDPAAIAEKTELYRAAHGETYARRELPPDSTVAMELLASGGVEFRIATRRSCGTLFGLALFLTMWIAAIVAMINKGVPIIFPIGFILGALIVIIGVIDAFFGRSVITAERGALTLRHTLFGYTWTTKIEPNDITSIGVKPTGSTSKPVFDVELRLRNHTIPRRLGCVLQTKDEAEIVAARVWRAVGRE